MIQFLHHWRHKNAFLLTGGFIVAFLISKDTAFVNFLNHLGNYGYLSAFAAGMLFASTFTVATGALILMTLAKTLSPVELIIIAVLGAAFTDWLIFTFVKDEITDEITPIYNEIEGSHFKKLLHTRYFGWTLPLVGVLIIASPFPDELGVSLLGLSKIRKSRFMIISLASHTIGMVGLISASLLV
jgi:hypothetical protein